MKKNNPVWVLAVSLVFLLIVFNAALFAKKGEYVQKINSWKENSTFFWEKTETGKECPDAIGGSEAAPLKIKYFYSNFCPWCRKEEPILKGLVRKHGEAVQINWYNLGACRELADKYKVSGVPTLVFNTIDEPAEYLHYGFTYEKDLEKLVCDVTGSC